MAILVDEDRLRKLMFAYLRKPREDFSVAVEEVIKECRIYRNKP